MSHIANHTTLQGPGRHLRVPARTRLIDDLLERELGPLVAAAPAGTGVAAQVVAFGAGGW